jgi:phosphatidylinositol 4-kinase
MGNKKRFFFFFCLKKCFAYIAAVFSEDWEAKKERIRASSPYGHLPNWRLISVIVKNGSDLRQEQFAIQLIREMQKIWQDTNVDVWVQ